MVDKSYITSFLQTSPLSKFGAEYDCGAYGAGAYNSGECGTSTVTTGLANTGYDVMIPLVVGIALLVLAAAMAIAMMRKKRRK